MFKVINGLMYAFQRFQKEYRNITLFKFISSADKSTLCHMDMSVFAGKGKN